MIKPFRIKTKHLKEFPELHADDVGMYAIRAKEDQDLMIYENKRVAQKAFEYFSKYFK